MMAAKAFVGAMGVVSVGASECSNSTLYPITTKETVNVRDVAVDSKGNLWLTASGSSAEGWYSAVLMCKEDEGCRSMGTGWNLPQGIAVDDSGVAPVVYVSEGDFIAPKVKKCVWNVGQDEEFSCSDFGSIWNSPRGVSTDNEGNVFIANAYGNDLGTSGTGVWKCSPSADCTVVGGSDHLPSNPPECVAVDSQGSVYVTGGDEDSSPNFVQKCTSNGTCSDFGGAWSGYGRYLPLVVGPDDKVYIIATTSNTLIQCSPDGVCEELGHLDLLYDKVNMAIDKNGALYLAGGPSVDTVCLPPSTEDIQV